MKKVLLIFMSLSLVSFAASVKPKKIKKQFNITIKDTKTVVSDYEDIFNNVFSKDNFDYDEDEDYFLAIRNQKYNGNVKQIKYFSRWHEYLKEVEEENKRKLEFEAREKKYLEEVERINNQNQNSNGVVAPNNNSVDVNEISLNNERKRNLANLEDSKIRLNVSDFKTMSIEESKNYFVKSNASWYNEKTNLGKATASGEEFDENDLTAAHKTLPLGTKVEVVNLLNNKKVIVKINDRGPYIPNREIDLSMAAFSKIADLDLGVIPITVKTIEIVKG